MRNGWKPNEQKLEDKPVETRSPTKKEVLQLENNNELIITTQVNEAIQGALDRVEYNLEMLRSLTKMPRNPTFIKAIAKRTKLGRKLLKLVASQAKLKLDGPLFRKRFKIVNGKIFQTAETEIIRNK